MKLSEIAEGGRQYSKAAFYTTRVIKPVVVQWLNCPENQLSQVFLKANDSEPKHNKFHDPSRDRRRFFEVLHTIGVNEGQLQQEETFAPAAEEFPSDPSFKVLLRKYKWGKFFFIEQISTSDVQPPFYIYYVPKSVRIPAEYRVY
jgi:hypothetical protein